MVISDSSITITANQDALPWIDLEKRLRGTLSLPDGPSYDDDRRTFNGMFDRRPAAIAVCHGADDVREVIGFARAHGLQLCVRGGGHGVAGISTIDGALMVDCAGMKEIDVNVERESAWAGAGLRLGELLQELEAHGFVSPTGTVSDTGMAGLTLGGGYGYLIGKYGMAIDNLLGAEMVLADGTIVTVNADEYPDLFWAIRGGGGNFGIVTKFHLRIHRLTQILGGLVVYPYDAARDFLRHLRDVCQSAPDELTSYGGLITLPDGTKAVSALTCWSGPMYEGEDRVAPLRSFGPSILDTIQPMTYVTMSTLLEEALPWGMRFYWKQSFFLELPNALIDTIVSFFDRVPSPNTNLIFDHVHGAARRVAPDATAFPHRDYSFGLVMLAAWSEPADDDRNISWVRELSAAIKPWTTGGVYINEAWDEPARAAFGQNWDRLREIKTQYDPENVFRFNTNIPPLADGH